MLKKIKNRKAYMIKTALYGCLKYLNDAEFDGKTVSVCNAIQLWRNENPSKFRVEASFHATEHIRMAIWPFATDTEWLYEQGINHKFDARVQKYRKAWVHRMIKQMTIWERRTERERLSRLFRDVGGDGHERCPLGPDDRRGKRGRVAAAGETDTRRF